jgi:acetolactate synthase-1/2/3 large subunit
MGVAQGSSDSEQVSRLIARFLVERGVARIFSLCGGHIMPIWDQVTQLGIRITDVRDERAAVHMAQAHSELTCELGVAIVTAGPGMTNAITGIANAHVSRVPLLIISGRPPRPQENMGALQELPQVEMIKPITRYARTITSSSHVLRELDEAVACAEGQTGEPGPAFIDFPTDLLREILPLSLVEHDRFPPREVFHTPPAPEAIGRAVDILWAARRPLVVSGRGAREAKESLVRLLDVLRCVYLDTTESRGLVPDDHPASMPAVRGRAMQEADVVLTVGRRLDFQLAYGSPAIFPNASLVRIGSCAVELRDNRRSDVEVFGSPFKVLEAILAVAGKRRPATDQAWVEEMRRIDHMRREKLHRELATAPPGNDGAMHPYRLLGCLRDVLNETAVVVADGGDILSFTRIALTGLSYLDSGGFGCLGVGVPFGIAAALAYPELQVVVISGDGAFGINAIELDTAKRHGARVVFVVANNAAWNIERNDQLEAYCGRIVGTELPSCDYAGLARALGLHGERVDDPADLPRALKQAFDKAPSLLDVIVTRDALSPDARSGLARVPDTHPLVIWDDMEKAFRGDAGSS